MRNYHRVPTSAAVWAAIRETHFEELKVMSSYSAPDGDQFGNPAQAVMFTAYGFAKSVVPICEVRTTWDAASGAQRLNAKHEFWLCFAMEPK